MTVPDYIFVFGSNLAGRHGAGAALYARKHFGAEHGVGQGLTGQSYAIPTKDENLRSLPLPVVYTHVKEFIRFARTHKELHFYITPVGCGFAGYSRQDIEPMFVNVPYNCSFSASWFDRRGVTP